MLQEKDRHERQFGFTCTFSKDLLNEILATGTMEFDGKIIVEESWDEDEEPVSFLL